MGLCAFYLMSIIGIALNMHYCGGKLSAVRFTETAKCGACKGAEKMKKSSNCCKDTSVEAKVKDSHEAGVKVAVPKDFSLELFLGPALSEAFRLLLPNLFSKAENKAPPLSSVLSLHAFNCVFRN
ncbi:hypothetical protein SAMN04488522_107162 [Pedobacter caeni]|uniref:Uncharacterized protein n=2 Tax=Pedobacter caeni TaxID=288992 RepID=A0A1M5ME38_9SPHI|nr:hypothetical protein SAMN04488522_107162 [Pedobacter caeni]